MTSIVPNDGFPMNDYVVTLSRSQIAPAPNEKSGSHNLLKSESKTSIRRTVSQYFLSKLQALTMKRKVKTRYIFGGIVKNVISCCLRKDKHRKKYV